MNAAGATLTTTTTATTNPSAAAMSAWGGSVASGLAILALAAAIGLAIGAIRIRKLKLGISGVLFSSLLFGQLGFTIEARVLQFLSSFALILFMYALGLEVGPGFGASLKAGGVRLNALSACVLVLGAVMALALAPLLPHPIAPGLYAGAFTTTPGLAAAQETFRNAGARSDGDARAARAGLAYSIAYPFGVVGPMLVIVALRRLFKVRLDAEADALRQEEEKRHPHRETVDIEVTVATLVGRRLGECPVLGKNEIIFSRLLRGDVVAVPDSETLVQIGDVYRAIGRAEALAQLIAEMGRKTAADLTHAHGDVRRMELVVTRVHVLHRSLRELNLTHHTGATIVHINRSGIDLAPVATLRLAFADRVIAVGTKSGLEMVEAELGNSAEILNHPQLIPIFLGVVLGVIVGSVPIVLPGLHGGLHIGLAGGSLLAAIALSRLGSVGAIVWYMPAAANRLFRDFGLAVFLACIGFQAGDHFFQRAAQNSGLVLFAYGAAITMLPVFIVACFARWALRMNFIALTGWIAGAMGSSTTLLFAEDLTSSNAPSITYAAVLPLATLIPILCAQILAILVMGG